MRPIINILLAISCGLFMATGCGGGHSNGAPVAVSGIHGLTQERIEGGAFTLTPRPPVINPLPHVILTAQRAGEEVARQTSDANGHFQFALPPDTYVVSPALDSPGLLPPAQQTVVVRAGEFTATNFTYMLEAP